ncbi:MAG: hypothetical protein IPF98_04820 [Gemmatimonadetes bacterium]|nr:hypothetical protein [Gemmatimonadota bacterium]
MEHVTLLCAGAFVTIAIAVLGGVTSWRATRTNVRAVLQDGSARAGSRREGRLSRALVATQVTTVTVLMFFGVMSGIMARRVVAIDPGYDVSNLLQGGIIPPPARYGTPTTRAALFRDVHARLAEMEALDGVLLRESLGERATDAGRFVLRDGRATGAPPSAYVLGTLGAVSTTGVTILEGRALLPSDDASRAPVVMVSRSLAARFWRGRSPLGRPGATGGSRRRRAVAHDCRRGERRAVWRPVVARPQSGCRLRPAATVRRRVPGRRRTLPRERGRRA